MRILPTYIPDNSESNLTFFNDLEAFEPEQQVLIRQVGLYILLNHVSFMGNKRKWNKFLFYLVFF